MLIEDIDRRLVESETIVPRQHICVFTIDFLLVRLSTLLHVLRIPATLIRFDEIADSPRRAILMKRRGFALRRLQEDAEVLGQTHALFEKLILRRARKDVRLPRDDVVEKFACGDFVAECDFQTDEMISDGRED